MHTTVEIDAIQHNYSPNSYRYLCIKVIFPYFQNLYKAAHIDGPHLTTAHSVTDQTYDGA